MKMYFEGAIFDEPIEKNSESMHFHHNCNLATMLKMCGVTNVFLWLMFFCGLVATEFL